jgi:hypothetical protein
MSADRPAGDSDVNPLAKVGVFLVTINSTKSFGQSHFWLIVSLSRQAFICLGLEKRNRFDLESASYRAAAWQLIAQTSRTGSTAKQATRFGCHRIV